MMEEYIWLFNRKEYKELAGSIFGSLLFHALLFAILASTSIFHPPIGDSEKLDILWFYPSAPSVWRTGPSEKVASAPAKEPEPPPLQRLNAAVPPPEKAGLSKTAPPKASNHEQRAEKSPPPARVAAVKPIVAVPAEEEAETETEPEMKIPAAIEPLPEVKTVEPRVESPLIKKAAAPEPQKAITPAPEAKAGQPQKPASPTKDVVAKAAEETTARPPVKEAVQTAVKNAEIAPSTANRQQSAESAVPPRETRATATEKQNRESRVSAGSPRTLSPSIAESAKGVETKTVSAAALPTSQPSGVSGKAEGEVIQKTAMPAVAAKPATVAEVKDKPQAKGAEGKGIFLPPVHGDLKLEIVGKDDFLEHIKVVVLFHELPAARRNRPMSKAEYGRFRTLSPRLIKTGDTTRQAVIEIAADGIYDFKVEAGAEQPAEVSFAVKFYDNTSKARTRPVGKRRISGSESVVKVLMPEGLLWDDDSAFSGSIEASDSTTKFNSDTGLVWKEYK